MFIFKRKNIYYVEFFDSDEQKNKRLSTGKSTKAEAMEFIKDFKNKLVEKSFRQSVSLSSFKTEYLKYTDNIYSLKYIRSIRLSFKMFEEFIWDKEISQISNIDAERFIIHTHKRAKFASLLYKRTLAAAFNKALSWNYITSNPFSKIKSPKLVKKLPVTISENELTQLLVFVNVTALKHAFLIAYYTGMRQDELANLKWDHINFEFSNIIIKNTDEFVTKSKRERIIPISKNILPLLNELKNTEHSDYVITNENGYKYHPATFSHVFKYAVRKARLSDEIHFHSLRHSFASNLVRKGVSLYVVKELLGHSEIKTTQIYSHLDSSNLIAAIEKL
ncbi:MAG: tyrosine-type recombinase/integrase [Bacteroidetes bacterium]|nr:tyrosine-type recombinase/integrase [Bacteroidota bacterium]